MLGPGYLAIFVSHHKLYRLLASSSRVLKVDAFGIHFVFDLSEFIFGNLWIIVYNAWAWSRFGLIFFVCLFHSSLVANSFPAAAVAFNVFVQFAGVDLLAFCNEAYWKHTKCSEKWYLNKHNQI